ncbi:MAG TPA: methylmalonyl Co-A mutase-associated GTPase MeaB [Actinomycetota bacterium]|nr:methylmalonyl Co-A mutase-associated GTPase MeaB [Actinomycetota bacterium]
MGLVDRARAGNTRAVARLLTLVESSSPQLRQVSAQLMPHVGNAHVVGITGAPGVGKSTTTSALIGALRERDQRVAVLAVDPSSPFSGGALLGDRVRMQTHATDSGVFIRSMASRGHLGGLSPATPQALRVLDACGFDIILVETVGVGQSEVEVMGQTDTVLVLLAPGMGDGIQVAKAGILEIADVFVVNKADRDGVSATTRELRSMLALDPRQEGAWTPPIITTVATRAEGVGDVLKAIDRHREWAKSSGDLRLRRLRRIEREIEALALDQVRPLLRNAWDLAERVLAGELDPYLAAQLLTESI